MAGMTRSVNRRELLDRVIIAVERASRSGGIIRLTDAAKALHGHQAWSVTLAEVEREIVRVAMLATVEIDFSDP